MGQFYDEIPDHLFPWIQRQKMFWVATAPLSSDGHVNVSPKGFEGTFHLVNSKTVWYEDLSGSGIETISHLRENGRMTIMFCAFEGGPRIVRLFGTGTVHEFDTPEYNALISLKERQPGSRAVIVLDVHKVGSSCGFSVPFYNFKSHRMTLHSMAIKKEGEDIKAEACILSDGHEVPSKELPYPERGLKWYWKNKNANSIDGLPGLRSAYTSSKVFSEHDIPKNQGKVVSQLSPSIDGHTQGGIARILDRNLFIGFLLGMMVSGVSVSILGYAGM